MTVLRREVPLMTEKSVDLDKHRGMAEQLATELRRRVTEVAADQAASHLRQAELEEELLARPAADWAQATKKARYVLSLYAASIASGDARINRLIAAVLDDFDRLTGDTDKKSIP
jgi:hypothetical protein